MRDELKSSFCLRLRNHNLTGNWIESEIFTRTVIIMRPAMAKPQSGETSHFCEAETKAELMLVSHRLVFFLERNIICVSLRF